MPPAKSTKSLNVIINSIKSQRGICEAVVLSREGSILYSHQQRPFLVNSVPFVTTRVEQAGKIFNITNTRYVAMQRGNGRKLLIVVGPTLLLGLEADETCLQKDLIDNFLPLLQSHSLKKQ